MSAVIYVLGIELDKDMQIPVGRLGTINFNRGFYFYVGSAKSRLSSRIKRHLSKKKKLFWHIDYLLVSRASYIRYIWVGKDKQECLTANLIRERLTSIGRRFTRDRLSTQAIVQGIRRFGCSDCHCISHLIFMPTFYLRENIDIFLNNFFKKHGFRKLKV